MATHAETSLGLQVMGAVQRLFNCCELVAGQWDSAFRGSGNDLDSRAGTAVPDGLGNGAGVTAKRAIHFSAVWTLWDRGDPGVLWLLRIALGMGAISTRALGAPRLAW